MAKARYEIHIPNHSPTVAHATHHYLTSGPIKGIYHARVSYGHPHNTLVVIGEESPELDSHMKQTGTYVGELTNEAMIPVIKQGKNIAYWPMRNPFYQPQTVTAPAAFSGPGVVPLPSAGPMAPAATQ